jgi:hypothetical protein
MTDQYTYPTHLAPGPAAPGGAIPPLPPFPQGYPTQPKRTTKGGLIAAAIVGAAAIALTAGGIGGLIGNHIAAGSAAQSSPPAAATPPAPTADQVHAATVDLCTRYVAADRSLPSPQNNGRDVIPSYLYVAKALQDTPDADSGVRDAVTKLLKFEQDQIAHFSHEPAAGAIQPPVEWSPSEATAASQKVWDLCKVYGS